VGAPSRRRPDRRHDYLQSGEWAASGHRSAIADAKAAGIVVLGYVFTNYGQPPSADVLDDIKRYYDFYSP
jgi:hypothetical protein